EPQGLDGRHPLPDPDPRQGPNRDEPPCPGLQHKAGDRDHRRGTADGGDQSLIVSLKPYAPIDQPPPRPSWPRSTARRPRRMTRFCTASVESGRTNRVQRSNHGHSAPPSWVTAPLLAWPTSLAYFAIHPALV